MSYVRVMTLHSLSGALGLGVDRIKTPCVDVLFD